MKIGIDVRLWRETGVGRYIRNLVVELGKIDKKNKYVLFVKDEDYKDVQSMVNGSPRVEASQWSMVKTDIRWHSIAEQLKFTKILNKYNLDLVHFPYFSVPIFYNRPFVVTIHDLIISHFPTGKASTLPYPLYFLKRIGYKKVLSHAVSKAKKIIVPLPSVKEDLIKTLKVPQGKIIVTKEGFDPSISKGEISGQVSEATKAPYFLYVGNAYPHKNLERLIEAISNFIRSAHSTIAQGGERSRTTSSGQISNIKLILVGKDDFFYKRLEKNKNKNIIFLHNVTDAELFYLYSHSVAGVSASLMEGFGLLPLEALGAGTIPAVSDIPAFREVCGELAIYFNPGSSEDIAAKLTQVLKLTSKEREEILGKGKAILKEFSWRKMAQETLEIYESCVGL